MTTPNTQGDSWEERLAKGLISGEFTGRSTGPSQVLEDFIRTLLSKERAEGERRGREETIKDMRQYTHFGEAFLEGIEKYEDEKATLPADSTEEPTCTERVQDEGKLNISDSTEVC